MAGGNQGGPSMSQTKWTFDLFVFIHHGSGGLSGQALERTLILEQSRMSLSTPCKNERSKSGGQTRRCIVGPKTLQTLNLECHLPH